MTNLISVCMIVKDEEKNLRRCLNSLNPILLKDYSELIVVDTGSDDLTVEIAKEYTQNVYFHEWNGNFSEMRNISISYAKGQWIFIIDADEELETPHELLALVEDNTINKFNTIRIKEKNLLSTKLNKYVYHVQERLFKNDGSFHYEGTIHNQPRYKHPILTVDNIWLMHYGYINEDKDLMEKKFKRTATMLKKELEINPDNVYYRFQLARSYMMHGDSVLAIEEITRAYEIMKTQDKSLIPYRYYIFGEYARMSLHTKKFDTVVKICKEGLSYNEHYLDLYYYMGHALLELNEFKWGFDSLNRYFELYNKYHKNELDLSKFTAIEMYTVDKTTYEKTIDRMISLIYKESENVNVDIEQYKVLLNKIDNSALRVKLLAKLLFLENNFIEVLDLYNTIEEEQRSSFINYLEILKENIEDEQQKKYELIFSFEDDQYGDLNKIRITHNRDKLLIDYINKYDVIKFRDETIFEFVKYLIEAKYLNRFFKKLEGNTIKKIVKVFIDKYDMRDYFVESLNNDFKFNDFQNNRLYISIANVLLLSDIENNKNETNKLSEEAFTIFENYVHKGIENIKYVYNTEHLRLTLDTFNNIEEKFFALLLLANDALQKENNRSFNRLILDASNEYPYLSSLLKYYVVEKLRQK